MEIKQAGHLILIPVNGNFRNTLWTKVYNIKKKLKKTTSSHNEKPQYHLFCSQQNQNEIN
jgi:hypothetical protein